MVQFGKLYHPPDCLHLTQNGGHALPGASTQARPHRLAGVRTGHERNVSARVSVVVPARNEKGRIGKVLAAIRGAAPAGTEIIVVDDASTDGTAKEASQTANVMVVPAAGGQHGKGTALLTGISAATGAVVLTCDADLGTLDAGLLFEMAGVLMEKPEISLVKARYRSEDSISGFGGGRVTELVAKPLLELFFPDLASLGSPLAGEMALRRKDALHIGLEPGYGVDIGFAIDIAKARGRAAIAEVDMGVKHHPHQPLAQLSFQAREVAAAILRRGLPGTAIDRALGSLASAEARLF